MRLRSEFIVSLLLCVWTPKCHDGWPTYYLLYGYIYIIYFIFSSGVCVQKSILKKDDSRVFKFLTMIRNLNLFTVQEAVLGNTNFIRTVSEIISFVQCDTQ